MSDEAARDARGIRQRWNALSSRNRERVILGTLFGVALAARDFVLLASTVGLFGLVEFADALTPRSPTPQAA